MFSLKERARFLKRISQQTTPTTNTTTTIPVVTQPVPQFNPLSGAWSYLTQSYNSRTLPYLRYILSLINTTMHYATNGQNNLQKNQNNLGSLDASSAFSVDGKNIILLAKLLYATFLNNGKPFEQPPTPQQIYNWANMITQSQPLQNLSQIAQTGQLAQQLNNQNQLDGSLKQNIINYLNYIVMSNPVQQQPR